MDPMNQSAPQQGAPAPTMSVPHRKGNGVVITIVVLLLLILAAYLLWPKTTQTVPNSATQSSTTPSSNTQNTQAQAEDLNSLQADIDATNVDGVSNGL